MVPIMVGAFAIPDNLVDECLTQATTEPGSQQPRRRIPQQNHNPTVFKNLVFTTWYAHGLRAIDISNPHNPREVGHALTVPQGVARTYPVFKDGLDLLGGQRHRAARGALHRAARQRAAGAWHGHLRGQCHQPPSLARDSAPHRRGAESAAYVQVGATTFTDSAMIAGGRTTFGSAGLSLAALGGSCTGPVTSTFLFTFADQFDSGDPDRTYIVADPPSALLRTYTVPPSVVFACTTQPVSVDLGAACSLGACSWLVVVRAPDLARTRRQRWRA